MAKVSLMFFKKDCMGCHACEVACKQEHNFTDGMVGIRVDEMETVGPDKVHLDFIPHTTRFCDLCADRTASGDVPACVKHCQATCMIYGPVSELVKTMEDKPRSVIIAPL